MDPALVSCRDCSRTWHSRTMAEGLRTIGRCPRCGGALSWAQDAEDAAQDAAAPGAEPVPAGAGTEVPAGGPGGHGPVAPHLVLGVPRR